MEVPSEPEINVHDIINDCRRINHSDKQTSHYYVFSNMTAALALYCNLTIP